MLDYLTTRFPAADDTVLEALLDASAGESCSDPPVTVYRPFWVEATQLGGAAGGFESVTSAAGSSVTYRDDARAIRALLRRQAALDAALCSIPSGFQVPGGSLRVVF